LGDPHGRRPQPDGYEVRSASSARELAEALAAGRAALVLLDIRMGSDNGIELARRLAEDRPEVAVVFLTGASYLLTAAENDLAHELIEKPFTIEHLRATVARLVRSSSGPVAKPVVPNRSRTCRSACDASSPRWNWRRPSTTPI
jgi:DNA-binding NtrC family response regulator